MITGKADCGLRYAVRKSGSAVGFCALSIKCGTRDELGYNAGIAHFVEHTLFKGTSRKKAAVINGFLDKLGGELNAYTTKEEIVIHATVLKEDIWKAADLLFELATSATFPDEEIETEKSVVIDEIKSYKDSPSEDVYDRFEEMLFEGHPLSGPILGTTASVKKISRSELLRFVKEKFGPANMAFSAVADIDETKLEKSVRKLASKWFDGNPDNAPIIVRDCRTPVPRHFDKTVNKKNHQVNCIIGSTAPSLYEDKERIAAILLCNILGGPASNSILNMELREKKGWVYGVECTYTQYSDSGIVAICLGCDKDNLEKCEKSISRELQKLQECLLSERKLKAAKKQFLGQLAISSDSGETQCLSMGKGLLAYGEVTSESQTIAKIEAITSEEIRAAAREIFSKDKLSRLVFI